MKDAGFTRGRKQIGRTVGVRAPAKVNLHLEVLRQRHDGFHEIETILQAVSLFDELRVTLIEQYPGGEPDIELASGRGMAGIPTDETNLCCRAARVFCKETRLSGRIGIHLDKEIPAAAGLGGGSSDAAAVLVACNHLFKARLPAGDLEKMGASLGSDVPFFIQGGTAMGRGTGTDLTQLQPIRPCQFLIVKPTLDLKTTEVYGNLKMGLTVNSAKANIRVIKPLLVRFPQENWPGFNRLEDVVLPSQPLLQRLVLELRQSAPVAMLAGSGSAVVGVFPDGFDVTEIVEEFGNAGLYVKVVGPHAAGVEITDD
jgi:4-diphosphocytidyl-2-C-methyl-D-erythritol kinase